MNICHIQTEYSSMRYLPKWEQLLDGWSYEKSSSGWLLELKSAEMCRNKHYIELSARTATCNDTWRWGGGHILKPLESPLTFIGGNL